MNWEALGALGEVAGAAALLFVVLQVRHARQEVQRSIGQNRTDTLLELIRYRNDAKIVAVRAKIRDAVGNDESLFAEALSEHAGVSADEATIIFNELMMWWQYYAEKVIRYIDELSPADRQQADAAMRAIFGEFAGRLFLEKSSVALNPDAYRYIQDLLNDSGE